MTVIEFVVHADPIAAPRPRGMGGHFVSNSARYLAYKESIAWSYKPKAFGIDPWQGAVTMTLRFFTKTRRRVDADNLAKGAMDALNTLAYADDSQIDELHVYRRADPKHPRVEVKLELREETA